MVIKVLNLYAGIGGNRKLWKNVKVTAVENNKEIAKLYNDLFPNDEVLIEDAHDYLLNHFEEYSFIWSSPPCQTHSGTNNFLFPQGVRRYPDLKLYEEILFLKQWCKTKWVVENVKPYYEPLVRGQESGRHLFWSNFNIPKLNTGCDIGTFNRQASKKAQKKASIIRAEVLELTELHGVDLSKYNFQNKRQVLRNAVLPKVGLHVFNYAMKKRQVLWTDKEEWLNNA